MNLDDLSARVSRVLGLRVRHRLGQLVERSCRSRLVPVSSVQAFRCSIEGWGWGAAVDAAGKATGAFTYGLIGLKGWFLTGAVRRYSQFWCCSFSTMVLYGYHRNDSRPVRWPNAGPGRITACSDCGCTALLPLMATGFGAVVGWRKGGMQLGLGHGAVDFAGSGVVHSMGGVIALAGAMVLRPRIGKFNAQGRPNAMPGHDVPMVALGTFILAFGWFGLIRARHSRAPICESATSL